MTGQQIRELRTARGWTQAQLARALGTDPVTVSRWERNISKPRPAGIRRLATLLRYHEAPLSSVGFAEDPTTRIRKLDSLRRQLIEMKRHARFE